MLYASYYRFTGNKAAMQRTLLLREINSITRHIRKGCPELARYLRNIPSRATDDQKDELKEYLRSLKIIMEYHRSRC